MIINLQKQSTWHEQGKRDEWIILHLCSQTTQIQFERMKRKGQFTPCGESLMLLWLTSFRTEVMYFTVMDTCGAVALAPPCRLETSVCGERRKGLPCADHDWQPQKW